MSVIRARGWPRLLVWGVIAQQLLIGAGVPLPLPAVAAHSAERYPCQRCGCGCRSAEQCWKECCCFSNRQKVAWARQHGVAVPAFVVAAAEKEKAAPPKHNCPACPRPAGPSSDPPSAPAPVSPDPGRGQGSQSGVCWLSALHCRGLSVFWQAAGPGWPADRQPRVHVVLLPAGQIELQPPFRYLFLPPAPPTPPPRPV